MSTMVVPTIAATASNVTKRWLSALVRKDT